MLIRIFIISLICLILGSCESKQEEVKNDFSSVESPNVEPQLPKLKDGEKEEKIAAGNTNPLNYFGNFMILRPTGRTNALNNPLYKLNLYADGKLVNSFVTVSGRNFTQGRNRNQSGTEAPLPDGKYNVSRYSVPGTIAEAGKDFLPIQPQFKTGRSALGFHVDPSYDKDNGEDGTAGCIGLTTKEDLDKLLAFVKTHKPEFLDVKIYNETIISQSNK